MEFASRNARSWKRATKGEENVARATADLEDTRRSRCVAANKPTNHFVARCKPEVPILHRSKGLVTRQFKPFVDVVQVGRKLHEVHFWCLLHDRRCGNAIP